MSKRIKEGLEIDIWALGTMLERHQLADKLREHNIHAVINLVVKPIDSKAIKASAEKVKLIVSIEDNVAKEDLVQPFLNYFKKKKFLAPLNLLAGQMNSLIMQVQSMI